MVISFIGLTKNPIDRKWRYYNDSNIPFEVANVMSFIVSTSLVPYVLFYRLENDESNLNLSLNIILSE